MFACQYEDVTPDILVTEKGLPAAMFLARPYSAAKGDRRGDEQDQPSRTYAFLLSDDLPQRFEEYRDY